MEALIKHILEAVLTHFKFANSTIHCSVQGTVELHGKRVRVLPLGSDSVDDGLELSDVVLDQFSSILYWIHHRLEKTKIPVTSRVVIINHRQIIKAHYLYSTLVMSAHHISVHYLKPSQDTRELVLCCVHCAFNVKCLKEEGRIKNT